MESSDAGILGALPVAVRGKVMSEGAFDWYKNELDVLKERINGRKVCQYRSQFTHPCIPCQFVSGLTDVLHKTIPGPDGKEREVFYEYDSETHEFIETDPLKMSVPDRINGEELNPRSTRTLPEGEGN